MKIQRGPWPYPAPPCRRQCCCTWFVVQVLQKLVIPRKMRTHTKTSALTHYNILEGTLGEPQTKSKYLSVKYLRIKKTRHLSLSRSKIDFWAAMWGVSGKVVAPNYVKIYVKHLLIYNNCRPSLSRSKN